jgi:hypothetical protein
VQDRWCYGGGVPAHRTPKLDDGTQVVALPKVFTQLEMVRMKRLLLSSLLATGLAVTVTARAPLQHVQAGTDPQLAVLLARAGAYLTGYLPLFSAVTAEEQYKQHFSRRPEIASVGRSAVASHRTLRSDFVLVRMPTAWMTFRDVFEVDGKPVRDPENRLQKVFLANWIIAVVQAAEIDDRCARYDIGDVNRALNGPAMPLRFLDLANQNRFEFRRGGEEVVEGVRASRLDYRETATPTFIAPDRADAFASGAVWLEPNTGRVVKTSLELTYARERRWLKLQATVLYRPVETAGMWLPAEMRERWQSALGDTTAVASYVNYRRFEATTGEESSKGEDERHLRKQD